MTESGCPISTQVKKLGTRQAVTELKISGNAIPYIVFAAEINTICCMLLVPNSHSVTACRVTP
ncbi:MAG: hypothetical protein ABH870_07370 [bacterium]